MQGQQLKVRYGGAIAGASGDRIALVSASGVIFASASTNGARSGDVTIPLYDSSAARQPVEGAVTVKWLRKNGSGVEQSIAEAAIELRPPVVRLFRHDLLYGQKTGQVRPLDEIVVDVGGGAPGWKLFMKRKSDGEQV